MGQRRTKPEVLPAPPASAASYGTALVDFRVPGPHGLVVFEAGRRVLVEPQIRRLLHAGAPIVWESDDGSQ